MRTAKQVIVMRKDLNMRKGKMIAQGAHAALAVFLRRAGRTEDRLSIDMTPAMAAWVSAAFTKVCVGVTSEEQLLAVYQRAVDAGLSCALITDSGRTEFGGVPTRTCCAIGPDWTDEVDAITGELPLL
jgi:PTH2 family peptidyl-tRNA hydrolase